jgi:hypothetical protein
MGRDENILANLKTGSIAEGISGIGATIVCIIGLYRIFPGIMLPIASILIGTAMLFKGGAVLSKIESIIDEDPEKSRFHTAEIGIGTTSESFGGITGIILGILSLLGITPMTLLASASIIFGVSIMVASGLDFRLNSISAMNPVHSPLAKKLCEEAVAASADMEILAGMGAVVLGILALLGFNPQTLILISMLSIGTVLFMNSLALWTRIFNVFRYRS